MVDFFEQKSEEMLEMTKHHVQELMSLWRDIFGTEECIENVCKLVHHFKNYYTDLIKESLEKKAYIEKEICDLQEEGETLRRLLKTDVQMPTINNGASNKPLLVVQMEMDKNLTAMRECMRKRGEEICELLLEQEELCEELGEPPRTPFMRSNMERLASMSPAARRLASSKLGIRSPLLTTPSPQTTPSRSPSIPAVRAKTTNQAKSKSGGDVSTLTDNLLQIPTNKRKQAADFF